MGLPRLMMAASGGCAWVTELLSQKQLLVGIESTQVPVKDWQALSATYVMIAQGW